ncbi:hypothetical protein ACIQGT_14270 [Streptomyces sp. NPDC093108]
MTRVLLGLVLGGVAAGITYGIDPVRPWWWAVGIVLVWCGEFLDDLFD